MYNLGEQFNFDYTKSKSNDSNIILGEKYRITVLSERLIRLEYNEDGIFENRPSERIWYRDMPPVYFDKKENSRILKIRTKYFEFTYVKNKSFDGGKLNPVANLKVNLLNSDRIWYYNHPEVRNYGSPDFSLDDNEKMKLKKGLYSVDGFSSIDDSNTLVFNENGSLEEREQHGIDIYLFMYLKDFGACLRDYFAITGYPSLIPRKALGNWWSKNVTYDTNSLKKLIENFEINNVPISVLLLDQKWHINKYNDKEYESGFSFRKELFEEPKQLLNFLHNKDLLVGVNINPLEGILPYEDNFEEITRYLEKDSNGIIPFNSLDSKVIDVFLKLLIYPLESSGIDFFWNDIKDEKNVKDLWRINHYEFLNNANKRRPMVLSRNAFVCSHRYPILYSGKTIVSWETLKMIPFYNESATNIGVSFIGHDIGGYYKGTEDNELYTRYVQLGVFSPILKFGSDKGKYYKREPWKWGVKTRNIVSDYLRLRHRLVPYLYSEAYKYSNYGIPLITPIYYSKPKFYDDINIRNEYLFGSELFVSPITTKKEYLINRVIHKFYLPQGIWYDFVTGKKFIGDKSHLSFFKDEDYPVFAKAGSIIPLSNDKEINRTDPPQNIEIQIFPGKSNSYKLYEDDGYSQMYKEGYYLLTSIDYSYLPNNYTVIVKPIEGRGDVIPEKRNYKFVFRNTREVDEVFTYFNDKKIASKKYSLGTNFIIEIENVPIIGQLTINCKGNDIEIDAVRIVKEDIESIISDLQIETSLKEMIDNIFFGELSIKKKRIEIRKLTNKGLDKNFVKMFLKLLEYIDQINI